jgi:hypothetical protein
MSAKKSIQITAASYSRTQFRLIFDANQIETCRIAMGGGDKTYMTMNHHKIVYKERRRRQRRILPVFAIFVISGIHLQFLYHAIVVDAAFDFTSNTSRSACTRQHRQIRSPHTNSKYHAPLHRTCLSSVVQDENIDDDDCDDNKTGGTTTPIKLLSPTTKIIDRRSMLLGTSAKATTAATSAAMLVSLSLLTSPEIVNAQITKDSNWPLWTALPVAPYSKRKTIMKKITDGVYIFDQLIGIYYVHVPIRMTVCVINDGLFVYAPVAPTKECLQLLQQLIDTYGPIQTIVLPSVAVEHKVNAGPFAKKFPRAEFYAVGKQYSFPLNLPSSFLGLPSWTKILPDSSSSSSSSNSISNMWNGQLEHEVLTVKPGIGSEFQDVAFYHKSSNTLLLCDTIVAVDENPPSILVEEEEYVKALLFHARDSPLEIVDDTIENRRKGWRRIVLLFNFFFPSSANVDLGLKPLLRLDPSYKYGWGGWMPFDWISEEKELQTFDAYKQNGSPTIFPIIQIILSRGNSGQETLRWVNKVKQWRFTRIIPQHLNAPITISPKEFEDVFSFINEGRNKVRFCDDDVKFLREAEEGFLNFSVYKSNLGTLHGKTNCK